MGVELIVQQNVSRFEVPVNNWWGTDFMQVPEPQHESHCLDLAKKFMCTAT
jgi:hypothetical protein